MICSFRRVLAAAALAFAAAPAHATTISPDFTDLWYNSAEAGWGFNIIQQGNALFGTLFVYGSDGTARWFVADGMLPETTTSGTFRFSGKFYQVSGPFFGAATFNPANVAVTEVGVATISFPTPNTATLVYNVNATSITKQMTRQTFRNNSPAGRFVGGFSAIASACNPTSGNGAAGLFGTLFGELNGSSATFRIEGLNGIICNFAGTWSQQGRLATVSNGTWSCTSNNQTVVTGTGFGLTQIDVQVNGLTSTFTASDTQCSYTGKFGGIRDANS